MAVIPEALVKKEAGIEILNDRSRPGTETLWMLIAVLSKSAVFTGTKGTLMDKYLAYIGDPETVNATCVAQYRVTSTQVAQACEHKFTFNPAKFSLDLGDNSYDLFGVPMDPLFYGAVFANRKMVGVIDDTDRRRIKQAFVEALPIVGKLAKVNPAVLQQIGPAGTVKKFGPITRALFAEDGTVDADMIGELFELCNTGARTLTGKDEDVPELDGAHPEVLAIANKTSALSKFTDDEFESSVYARLGDVAARNARQKMRSELQTDNKKPQFFVFKQDIATAKEYLAEQGKPHTEFDAIGMLADTKRTGDRRFPRWGVIYPAKCMICGSRNLILGDAASKVGGKWENLYSDIANLNDTSVFAEDPKKGDKIRAEVLRELVHNGQKGESLDLSTGTETITVRPPYAVTFTGPDAEAKINGVMKLLYNVATGIRTPQKTVATEEMAATGKEGDSMTDSVEYQMSKAMEQGAIEKGSDELREIINVPNENKVFDAAVRIFKEFPELQKTDVFQKNKDLFARYRAGQHELHSTGANKDLPLDEDEIATLAAETIHAMIDSRGAVVTRFFDPSRFRIVERLGIPYIANWGLTDQGEYLMQQYTEKMNEREGQYAGSKFDGATVRNMFPYMLLRRQFDAMGNKWASGAIRDLVAFESDLKDFLVSRPEPVADANSKTLGEFKASVMNGIQGTPNDAAKALSGEIQKLKAQINLGNLGVTLGDASEEVISTEGYDELMCTLFAHQYQDQEARIKYYRGHLSGTGEKSGILDMMQCSHLSELGEKLMQRNHDLFDDIAVVAHDKYEAMLDDKVDAAKRKQLRIEADNVIFEMFDMAVVNAAVKGIGAIIAAISPVLLNGGSIPLVGIVSSAEFGHTFDIAVKYVTSPEPETLTMGPIGLLLDSFLGKYYDFGDSVVAAIGNPLKEGDYEGLGEVLRHIYLTDRDVGEMSIITIPGLRPTPKPIPTGKLNTEVRNIDRAGDRAGSIRNAHDDKWLASVMPNDEDGGDLLKQIRQMKAERALALQKKNGTQPAAEQKPAETETKAKEAPEQTPENIDWSTTMSDVAAHANDRAVDDEQTPDAAEGYNYAETFDDGYSEDEPTRDF